MSPVDQVQCQSPAQPPQPPLAAVTLDSTVADGTGSSDPPQPQEQPPAVPLANTPKLSHQGRVRTGCLVCRARKIKCDEQRPNCHKCVKSKRRCVYKRGPPAVPLDSASTRNEPLRRPENSGQESPATAAAVTLPPPPHGTYLTSEQLFSPDDTSHTGESELFDPTRPTAEIEAARGRGGDSTSYVDTSPCNHQADGIRQGPDLSNAESPSARFYNTSLDIYLVTTLDWMGASALPNRPFTYFIEEVDCPFISPFDNLNWKWIKFHLAQLAIQETSIAAAILVFQSLYRVMVNGLPMSNATAEYRTAMTNLELMVGDDGLNFETILVVAFLLCLCQVTIPNEDGPYFHAFGPKFETRLETWLESLQASPVALRICTWLQLLHVATKRVGNCGLLPETMFDLLSNNISTVPSLSTTGCYTDSADAMYDVLSAPLYKFYFQIQRISNESQGLSHYRRSRITPADQAEAAGIAVRLRRELSTLWNTRPGPLRFQPGRLRQDLREPIAEPLLALTGLCIAAYSIENVALRRILGDPPFPSPESAPSLRQIRDVIDGDWNVSSEGALNPGYVRPLFLYAIENIQREETQWAVTRLRQVKSPLSRSDFVASLAEALGEAQRTEQRRVTTKYFCYRSFNVPVPLI
ncbi:uncharacterized protein Z520_05122 [Fonsecaea multimorphosa CBS 102226]|uniref:Zn(2)-C6 fungal-type domain-containing protein n=1 Tax=Fonsecaea multimorphosa CBS 102226 TaxID=1442371 RepID=A0A0D2IRC1_9EURO|nr:uncharacterized protein Z520_05122 [Fonsecaea multimorphosa CBS 102226]KIX99546.1 hypothetical protein Z520_05122 [Fonsecaea multimorphosa CBS 102226]OAL25537.1 hypothetical protein AYO22_04856 [Fonsecaea multimorphosa]